MWRLVSLLFITIVFGSFGQYNWTWTEMQQMPFRTSNNAVCEASVGGNEFVYSFGGIDTSKAYSGIHQRAFKYDVTSNVWSEIASLPDTLGKIASGASFVNGKIYILGGYHVFPTNMEVSSDRVHVYNPTTESYEANGAAIPVPIDDHVQCVYKDSLIFVVTGWSNTGNVPNVQIYNPSLNQWQAGTSTINNAFYTAFGASGYIIGDTLYYHGGASGGAFGAKKFMRRGYINPTDPTDITWGQIEDSPGDAGYRSACSGVGNTVFWVGGSGISYNYDGIAYSNGAGVEPLTRVLHFGVNDHTFADETSQPYGVMDLRGIAKLTGNRWVICGGMDSSQVVTNRTFLLENPLVEMNESDSHDGYKIHSSKDRIQIVTPQVGSARLVSAMGSILVKFPRGDEFILERSKYAGGIYFFEHEGIKIRILL
ncbi:MAG: hypothetical protein P8P87_12980 [Crocinitomicaceae bacterium]|nr:hypothetical protein [Crocinitomicaceae bacterium]